MRTFIPALITGLLLFLGLCLYPNRLRARW